MADAPPAEEFLVDGKPVSGESSILCEDEPVALQGRTWQMQERVLGGNGSGSCRTIKVL